MPNTRQVDAGFKIHWQSDVICYLAELESTVTLCAETEWIFIIHHTSYIIHHTSSYIIHLILPWHEQPSLLHSPASIEVRVKGSWVSAFAPSMQLSQVQRTTYPYYLYTHTDTERTRLHLHARPLLSTIQPLMATYYNMPTLLYHFGYRGRTPTCIQNRSNPTTPQKRYDRDMTELTENSTGDVSMEAIACIGKGKTS